MQPFYVVQAEIEGRAVTLAADSNSEMLLKLGTLVQAQYDDVDSDHEPPMVRYIAGAAITSVTVTRTGMSYNQQFEHGRVYFELHCPGWTEASHTEVRVRACPQCCGRSNDHKMDCSYRRPSAQEGRAP